MKRTSLKEKKAVSHIEMAISFGMFILFVFFLLVYLKPIRTQNISDVLIDAVITGLEKNATIQLIELSVTLKASVAEDCFSITNPFATTNPRNMFIKDENDNLLKFTFDNDNIKIEKSGNFYYIFFAEETFDPVSSPTEPCTSLNTSDYEYAASKTYELFSSSKLEEIVQNYSNNYEELKKSFNFPVNYDFTVKIMLMTTKQEIFSMERAKPEKVEVVAQEVPMEILQRDGSILRTIANVQVW
jgi:hypothetical protein